MENKRSDTHDRELIISRKLNAPVVLVWEVWTTPEHIANWWGPNGFTNTIHTMDFVTGGAWDFVMHGPDGTDYKNTSIFNEIVPFKKIVYEHVTGPRFTATIQFEAQGKDTLITWHMLFETAEQFIQVVKTFKADEGVEAEYRETPGLPDRFKDQVKFLERVYFWFRKSFYLWTPFATRRNARAVEWDGLENRYTRKGIEGSNPSFSAKDKILFCYTPVLPVYTRWGKLEIIFQLLRLYMILMKICVCKSFNLSTTGKFIPVLIL